MFAEHQYFRKLAGFTNEPGLKFAKTASTAFTVGSLVAIYTSTGYLRMAQAGDKILGICKRPVVAADADYAANSKIEIEVLTKKDEVVCPISAGSLTIANLGNTYDVVSGGLSISLSATTYNDFRLYNLIGSETAFVMGTVQTSVF